MIVGEMNEKYSILPILTKSKFIFYSDHPDRLFAQNSIELQKFLKKHSIKKSSYLSEVERKRGVLHRFIIGDLEILLVNNAKRRSRVNSSYNKYMYSSRGYMSYHDMNLLKNCLFEVTHG